MALLIFRFVTLILIALSMGMAFCHTLELPAKMQYDGALYVRIQNSLYVAFGPPNIGAFIEVAAVVAAFVLTILVRKRRPAFPLTLVGTIFLLLAFPVVFFLFTEPANTVLRQATPQSLPANWLQLRSQWEYSHAARFFLQLIGFSLLLLSVLRETPTNNARDRLTSEEIQLTRH
ncbi:MAG: DUF1772 domain-containing protein [Aulosira sp. ZfuVER01]|nr:DUF1772 domain-containing protein [Aulosira sp. ZfuVER01]MDZ7998261.1 DUF1772 domain-containing protein [Aulosira sp. DedVER01a]MDZ8055505.1 DUF1772 domain-containing protein [Aulosira sp. ZfuCHP01]